MKISIIAARLRRVARGLEILAAKQGDSDLPDEMVSPFIVDVVTHKNPASPAEECPGETRGVADSHHLAPVPGAELWPRY